MSTKPKHTPGPIDPLYVRLEMLGPGRRTHLVGQKSENGTLTLVTAHHYEGVVDAKTFAARVVACVNFCKGYDNETLEKGPGLSELVSGYVAEARVNELHSIADRLALAYRGHLPHENAAGEFHSSNTKLSADTRTRLALIEDCIARADAIARAEGRKP